MSKPITITLSPAHQDLLMTTISFASNNLEAFCQWYTSIGLDGNIDLINRTLLQVLQEVGKADMTQAEIDNLRRDVLADLQEDKS